jgi:hypothetical protein
MADDEFDEEEEPEGDVEDLDPEDIDEELDPDLIDDAIGDDETEELAEGGTASTDDDDDDAESVDVEGEDEDVVVALDDETHPDDVEASLDVLLKERTTSDRPEDEEPEDADDDAQRGEGDTKIKPRGADEFLCTSCFLVLPMSQLAAGESDRCRDCA